MTPDISILDKLNIIQNVCSSNLYNLTALNKRPLNCFYISDISFKSIFFTLI